jgi:hypothetical protein
MVLAIVEVQGLLGNVGGERVTAIGKVGKCKGHLEILSCR